MKVQKDVVFYTCAETELVDGKPPEVDENGVAPEENAICEVLNTAGNITVYFQWAGGEWWRYGEIPN